MRVALGYPRLICINANTLIPENLSPHIGAKVSIFWPREIVYLIFKCKKEETLV